MLEKEIESKLKDLIESKGGEYYKFTSPARRGVPDRLVIFDVDLWFFVELKSEEGELEPWQEREIRKLKDRGVKVFVINDLDGVWYIGRWIDFQKGGK
jgi:VRR-NUC domain